MAGEKQYRFKQDDGRSAFLLIGALLVAVLIVGGGLVYVIMQKNGVEPVTPVQPPVQPNQTGTNLTNQTPPLPACDDACLYGRAVASGNYTSCANLSTRYVQPCYEAFSNVSLDACKAVSGTAVKNACIAAFAVSSRNLSLCDLGGNRTACRHAVDPCADAADKLLCNALGKNDPLQCNSDAWCLMNYSIATGNFSSCSRIQNAVVFTTCVSAVRRTDLCAELPLPAEKDYCYQLYATYTGDYSACYQISSDSIYALNCFSLFAAETANLSMCEKDGLNLNSLWDCYTNYSLLTGDLAGCRKIDALATTHKFACVIQFAKTFGDVSACEAITDTLTQRANCYEAVLIGYWAPDNSVFYTPRIINWVKCAGVSSDKWKNKCYTESAKLYNDSSLCNYASEAYARQSCLDAYAANRTG